MRHAQLRAVPDVELCEPIMKQILLVLVAAAVLTAPVASADGTINDMEGRGPLEQPFYGYLYRSGYGYLDSARAGADGKIACVNDEAGVAVGQIISLLEARGNSTDEARAIVFAMQKQNASDAYEPLC